MSEAEPGSFQPSPKDLGLARQAFEKADPTTYSKLNPVGEMEKIGTVVTRGTREHDVFKHENDTYYKIEDGPSQQVITRLLKGIINVSDIVTREGEADPEFFSRHIPLDKVEERVTQDEVLADIRLLGAIFSDTDRARVKDGYNNAQQADSKVSFYDFGESRFSNESESNLSVYVDQVYKKLPFKALVRLKEKLTLLRERLSNEEGKKFFMKIYSDAVKNDSHRDRAQDYGLFYLPKANEADQVYAILQKRIERTLQNVEDALAED